jgi:uncharacterized protein
MNRLNKIFWISKGGLREVPITVERVLFSLFSLLFFLFGVYFIFLPLSYLYFITGNSDKKVLKFHNMLMKISKFVIHRVPGVKFNLTNKYGELFNEPAVIISNHQSHLDLMCIMMLTPRLIILTNDWVWNNPFYGHIIKRAQFYPVSDGIEKNIERLNQLMNKGYSVMIFPEGTRSEACNILRFHQGAFYLAEELKKDIVPIFIHGAGHVLPKKDFMLRRGSISVEVAQRIKYSDRSFGETAKERRNSIREYYISHFEEIKREREKSEYWSEYVKYKYKYKGYGIEHSIKRNFNNCNYTNIIDNCTECGGTVWVINSGYGEFALLYALVHRETSVYAFEKEISKFKIATENILPDNLHFINAEEPGESCVYPSPQMIYKLSNESAAPLPCLSNLLKSSKI